MSDYPARSDLTGEVRMRVPLPLLIPLGAFAFIAVVAVGFSRVLLSLPKEAATVVALAVAANILAACAFAALRPRMARLSLIELLLVVSYPLIIGIVIARVGFGGTEGGPHTPSPAPPGGVTTELSASGNAFDKSTITLAAGQEAEIEFSNEDTVEHNLAIYESQEAGEAQEDAIFDGELIAGGESTEYTFEPPPDGEYYFQCDVHPGMNGTVTVE